MRNDKRSRAAKDHAQDVRGISLASKQHGAQLPVVQQSQAARCWWFSESFCCFRMFQGIVLLKNDWICWVTYVCVHSGRFIALKAGRFGLWGNQS